MNSIIIQGSARSNGNTYQISKLINQHFEGEIIDLNQQTIHSYSYDHQNMDDDFLPTMKELLDFDTIIFITPVYWYSMSGIMKNFFDRMTDCLQIEKETGRRLRGKNMIAVACGSDDIETEGFFVPFKNSAEYLGMNYLGNIHTWIEDDFPTKEVINRIELFATEIKVQFSQNKT